MTGERAWAILGAAIVAYELTAEEGQLLSEAVDRWLISNPWPTRILTGYLACHLLNLVPQKVDPLHWVALAGRRTR